VQNLGQPIKLTNVSIHGVAGKAVRPGEKGEMWSRFVLSSDQAIFHRITARLARAIEDFAVQDGVYNRLDRADIVLLVIRPDNTADLWLDTAAVMHEITLKRAGPLAAGTVMFESELADIRGVWFPFANVGVKDRILCIIRQGWRFGLLYDGNAKGDLSIEDAKRDLARPTDQ